MKKLTAISLNLVYVLATVFLSNGYMLFCKNAWWLLLGVPLFLVANVFVGSVGRELYSLRYKVCRHGVEALIVLYASAAVSIGYHVWLAFYLLPDRVWDFVISAVICFVIEAILFWNGMLCMYFTSAQLGIKHRVVGLLCGFIPIANAIVLQKMIRVAYREIQTETDKEELNRSREQDKICETKYPILFVHGVFFRDTKLFNYWGRIPKELERNGATVYYGQHQSASSVADSAQELADRIKRLVAETGCEKVNIIAHSKGGLDCRYAIKHTDVAPNIASLTTVNTPHRGCGFADYLLEKASKGLKEKVECAYNGAMRRLGDKSPDFMAAVTDLTASRCMPLDEELGVPEGILCQSIGSCIKRASYGKFPLNFSYRLDKYFDGPNDGLVAESSFKWGDNYTYLKPSGRRGISHGDMIDLNRENIKGFDVREYYVKLVSDLKSRGL